MQEMPSAFCLARANAGRSSPARMAIIAITTNSSINVKPRLACPTVGKREQAFMAGRGLAEGLFRLRLNGVNLRLEVSADEAVHAIDEEDALKMIPLVLDGPRQKPTTAEGDCLASANARLPDLSGGMD